MTSRATSSGNSSMPAFPRERWRSARPAAHLSPLTRRVVDQSALWPEAGTKIDHPVLAIPAGATSATCPHTKRSSFLFPHLQLQRAPIRLIAQPTSRSPRRSLVDLCGHGR
eukprot:363391-Chlamydomonas_euryale.AAC.10